MPTEAEEAGVSSSKVEASKAAPIALPPRPASKKGLPTQKGVFQTIDQSFVLTKSQLEEPIGIDVTHLYNGQPTQDTDIAKDEMKIDPAKTAMLDRTNFLTKDGVLYEIKDAPDEQEALWTFNGKTHLTHEEYLREMNRFQKLKLQYIVVKQNISKTRDYSKSP